MWKTLPYGTTKLTIELRELVESGVKLWDFEYPSYYEGKEKADFEKKVIDHYYFRQIGQETVGRFLHVFRTKIREIMPYYIEMYRTVEIMAGIEDPFGNIDIVETYEEKTTGTASGMITGLTSDHGSRTMTNTETSESLDTKSGTLNKEHRFSNTPQNLVDNLDSFLTEASKDSETNSETLGSSGTVTNENSVASNNTGSTNNTSQSDSSGTVSHTLTRKGNQGVNTYAHDMIEFRKSIINVDMMIINELNELFLGVY